MWFPDAFPAPWRELMCAVEENSVPEIDGEDNLKTMAAVDTYYLSAREGRAVTLAEVMKVEPTSGQGSPTSRRSGP